MAEIIVEKVCTRCKTLKPLTWFGAQKRKKDGREAQCLECVNVYRKARRNEVDTPERLRARHLWSRYKLRPEEYDAMLQSQDGVCAVCRNPPKGKERYLRIDHCHDSNLIRGLLCVACNIGIGSLGDSIEGLERAAAYLRRFEQGGQQQPSKVAKSHVTGTPHHWYGKASAGPRGSKHPNALLTEEKVKSILREWATGNVTQGQLGTQYGVSAATIQKVIHRETWKHITV